jgi:hypothetical protein
VKTSSLTTSEEIAVTRSISREASQSHCQGKIDPLGDILGRSLYKESRELGRSWLKPGMSWKEMELASDKRKVHTKEEKEKNRHIKEGTGGGGGKFSHQINRRD